MTIHNLQRSHTIINYQILIPEIISFSIKTFDKKEVKNTNLAQIS